jgi:hypothetical protein
LLHLLQETVLLWEQLRPKQTTKEQKEQLVANILKKVSRPHAVVQWLSSCFSTQSIAMSIYSCAPAEWCLSAANRTRCSLRCYATMCTAHTYLCQLLLPCLCLLSLYAAAARQHS